MVVVGPSGCGKTTMLRVISGLEAPDAGSVGIDGTDVTQARPAARNVGMVFQQPALLPHLTVRENVGFGLKVRRERGSRTRVDEALELAGISHLADRHPAGLSGGEAQLAALARAAVREPAVFLLDEPLSSLDARVRTQMRAHIRRIQRTTGRSMLYVTHDQVEAMTLGDRLAVLSEGRILQVGTPAEVFERPATREVATFIGSPQMNVLPLERAAAGWAGGPFRMEGTAVPQGGGDLELGVRPEHIRLAASGDEAVVEVVEVAGSESFVHLSGAWDGVLVAQVDAASRPAPGDHVRIDPAPTVAHVFRDGVRIGP